MKKICVRNDKGVRGDKEVSEVIEEKKGRPQRYRASARQRIEAHGMA